MARLALIGGGMMGEALARGLIAAGWAPGDLVVSDVRRERVDELVTGLGIVGSEGNREAASQADAVLVAVKPQDARAALEGMGPVIGEAGVISIVAGLRTSTIEAVLGGGSVVRAMPNTPARVGRGVTALAPGAAATDATRDLALEAFSAVGPVVWVEEDQLDAVTALSGSGPAYVFFLAEAMVEAGANLGLPSDVVETLVFATIEGAGRMLTETGERPDVLRGQVTSPGGTTAAAVAVLEDAGVRAAFGRAIQAASKRSRELAG